MSDGFLDPELHQLVLDAVGQARIICDAEERRTIFGVIHWRTEGGPAFVHGLERGLSDDQWSFLSLRVRELPAVVELQAELVRRHPDLLGALRVEDLTARVDAASLVLSVLIRAGDSPEDASIRAAVSELSSVLAQRRVTLRVRGMLERVEWTASDGTIRLGEGINLRRMPMEEVARLCRRDATDQFGRPTLYGIRATLEATADARLVIDADIVEHRPNDELTQDLIQRVDDASSVLHAYKSGQVCLLGFHVGFVPFVPSSLVSWDVWRFRPEPRSGRYEITDDDVVGLAKFAERMANAPQRIRFAASRLRDAELRHSPRDSIIDACIGLESILNFAHNEVSYRMALNYAVLHPPDERLAAKKRFGELYSVRSGLMHGGDIKELKVGGQRCTMEQAALMLNVELRKVIHRTLDGLQPGLAFDGAFWDALVLLGSGS